MKFQAHFIFNKWKRNFLFHTCFYICPISNINFQILYSLDRFVLTEVLRYFTLLISSLLFLTYFDRYIPQHSSRMCQRVIFKSYLVLLISSFSFHYQKLIKLWDWTCKYMLLTNKIKKTTTKIIQDEDNTSNWDILSYLFLIWSKKNLLLQKNHITIWKWKRKEERMKREKWRKIERKELDREWEEEHVLTIFFIYQSIYWFMLQVFHHNAIQFVVNIRIKFCPFYVSLLTLWRKSTNYLENKKKHFKIF